MSRAHDFRSCRGAARLNCLATGVNARRRINEGAGVVLAGAGIATMVK